ncbi:MAG: aspartyl/glutamyl-tRNA amidotransferase subunit C [Desulfobacterales bacterium]|nr:aspartyl/glutamyl-tRNA amidotransferase subunit C [Desulfobacterales bacterium]
MANAFRRDVVAKHLENEDALGNAPESEAGSFVVPKVIE